jgi:transcriptional regulator with XRE-family HTH domain
MRRLLERLADMRVRLGLRQSDVAQAIGVSPPVISRLESGATDAPSFRDIVLVGAHYGLSPNTLAQLAELIPAPDEAADPRLEQLAALLHRLPPAHRDELLNFLVLTVQSRVQAFGDASGPQGAKAVSEL